MQCEGEASCTVMPALLLRGVRWDVCVCVCAFACLCVYTACMFVTFVFVYIYVYVCLFGYIDKSLCVFVCVCCDMAWQAE